MSPSAKTASTGDRPSPSGTCLAGMVAGKVYMADILTKAQATAVFTQLMESYDAFVHP